MRLFLYKIWLQTIKQYYSMMKKTIQFVPIIAIAMQALCPVVSIQERIYMIRLMKHLTQWVTVLPLPTVSIGT